MKTFRDGGESANGAYAEAQRLAFAPVVFQCLKVVRDSGMLKALAAVPGVGLDVKALMNVSGLSEYAVRVVCETALSSGAMALDGERFVITPVGKVLEDDEVTRANFDFVAEVCYDAMAHLPASLKEGRPAGLKVFGDWPTIYPALSALPPKAQEAWFRFDHIYSDSAFTEALRLMTRLKPKRLLDIGGNTGKWALQVAGALPDVEVTIADLPGQLNLAKGNIARAGLSDRVHLHAADMLSEATPLPTGFDVVWMSQFLVCFSLEQVADILRRAAQSLAPNGRIVILDTYWDRQREDIAAYCIINTSPYFTCLANGNSRMYTFKDLAAVIEGVELKVAAIHDEVGLGHTLVELVRR